MSHIMHVLTMEMEIRIFWRVFRTSVIVFDFRTNYGKSILVDISVKGHDTFQARQPTEGLK